MKKILLGIVGLVFSANANAALIERMSGLAYYDDVLDITWTADAYTTYGNWSEVRSAVYNFNLGGASDWRLASVDLNGDEVIHRCSATNSSCGFDNEFSYHFWVNGISEEAPGVFSDVRFKYWTKDRWDGGLNHAYTYAMSLTNRGHSTATTGHGSYGWAVHDGDPLAGVVIPEVPIPAAAWLFGSGLLSLISIGRRV